MHNLTGNMVQLTYQGSCIWDGYIYCGDTFIYARFSIVCEYDGDTIVSVTLDIDLTFQSPFSWQGRRWVKTLDAEDFSCLSFSQSFTSTDFNISGNTGSGSPECVFVADESGVPTGTVTVASV